jgi:hypothetical protein
VVTPIVRPLVRGPERWGKPYVGSETQDLLPDNPAQSPRREVCKCSRESSALFATAIFFYERFVILQFVVVCAVILFQILVMERPYMRL